MTAALDRQTIERLRTLDPGEALRVATNAVYEAESVGCDDFLDLYERLVYEGVVTWAEIEAFERAPHTH